VRVSQGKVVPDGSWPGKSSSASLRKAKQLTAGLDALAQLRLHLAVGPLGRQVRQLAGHGGGGDDGLEAALAFGDVLLGVEDDDVDLRHVEHAQGDGGAEAEGHGQRGRLDVHLRRKRRAAGY